MSKPLLTALLACGLLACPAASDAARAAVLPQQAADEAVDPPVAEHDEALEQPAEQGPLLQLDPGSAIWNLLIFLAVLFILGKFVWPHVLNGLQSREQKIRGDLEGAERANADARRLLSDYQQKLDEAQTQVQAMLADARRDAQQAHQKIVDDAKVEAERQRARAVGDIENAKKVALSELAGQTSDIAMQLARQVVGRELNQADHADLIRQSLDGMPSKN